MNVKNLLLIVLLPVVSAHGIGFETTYTDAVKLGNCSYENYFKMKSKPSGGQVINTTMLWFTNEVFVIAAINSNERRNYGVSRHAPIEWLPIDSMRHNLWYNCTDKKDDELSVPDVILEPVFFAIANPSLRAGINKLNEFDTVKNIVQHVPAEHGKFILKNGRMVAAAAVARGGRILVQEGSSGLNNENGQKFLRDAGMQVGSEFMEEYIVNPIVDKVIGNDDCLSGDILKVGLNAATFYVLSSMLPSKK